MEDDKKNKMRDEIRAQLEEEKKREKLTDDKKNKMREELRAQLEEEKMREELTKELRAEMGMPQKNSYSVAENEKDRIIAILLAFFGWFITAQKFYLNSPSRWALCIISLFT